jgi:rod shape-determining protein MreC
LLRRAGRDTPAFAAAATACLLLILLTALPGAAGPRAGAKSLLTPLQAATEGFLEGAGGVVGVFGDVAALRDDRDRLARDNASLRRQLAQAQAASAENDSLRRALDFQQRYGHRTRAAAVVGRGSDPLSASLAVDRGYEDGIGAGMVVVSGAGLLGRVREVTPHSSFVQTLADPASRVNCYTVQSGLEGTLSGGTAALGLQLSPRPGIVASAGDWVLTSGVGDTYPRGLVVGQLTRFDRRDSATLESAAVMPAADPRTATSVLVILDFAGRP